MLGKLWSRLTRSADIDGLVDSLLNELMRRYPPSMAAGEGRRLSQQAVTNILESVINKAVHKSKEWNLGVVGKAQLGNRFKWALKEKGYPDKFIDIVTEALIVYTTRKEQR